MLASSLKGFWIVQLADEVTASREFDALLKNRACTTERKASDDTLDVRVLDR